MKFVLSGNFKIGDRFEKFEKNIEAKDEAHAKELIYSQFGSEHGTKRRWVKITKVSKAKEE